MASEINEHYEDPLPTAFDDFHLVLLEHGPNRAAPQNEAEQAALDAAQAAHLAFLKDLFDKGLSFGAGPFKDGSGGLILIRGERISAEELEGLLANDPHVQSGRLVAIVRPFIMPKGII
ncbi:MAG: YciI family protein [Chloroflexota bacterium]